MVAIIRLGHIQVKGEIVRIMTWIHREGRQKLEDQRTNVYKNMCTRVVD